MPRCSPRRAVATASSMAPVSERLSSAGRLRRSSRARSASARASSWRAWPFEAAGQAESQCQTQPVRFRMGGQGLAGACLGLGVALLRVESEDSPLLAALATLPHLARLGGHPAGAPGRVRHGQGKPRPRQRARGSGRLIHLLAGVGRSAAVRSRLSVSTRRWPAAPTTCDTRWLNAGVPIAEVARRVGNSPEVINRRYHGCIDGHEEAANAKIAEALEEDGDNS